MWECVSAYGTVQEKTTESERLLEWWQDLWSDNEAAVGRIRQAAMVLVIIGQQCKAFKSVIALNTKIKTRKKSEVLISLLRATFVICVTTCCLLLSIYVLESILQLFISASSHL